MTKSASKKGTKGSTKKKTVKVAAKETPKKVKAIETVDAPVAKTPVAKPVKEKKPKGPVVVITSAMYGSAEKAIEVAPKMIVGRKITNKLAGEDPCPKVKKTLAVKATVDGSPVEKTFNEGDKLIF